MTKPIILTDEEITRSTMPENKHAAQGDSYYVTLGDARPEVDRASYIRVCERVGKAP
ncbi:MAG: hypothetical protein JWN48_1819 [Myxococcaceae bacterium]|nr:hypothetical protein [Myxococcaceae bacterium]